MGPHEVSRTGLRGLLARLGFRRAAVQSPSLVLQAKGMISHLSPEAVMNINARSIRQLQPAAPVPPIQSAPQPRLNMVFRSGESSSAASNQLVLRNIRLNAFMLIRSSGATEITEKITRAKQGGTIISPRVRTEYVNNWKKVLDIQISRIKNTRDIALEDKVHLIQELIDEIRSYGFLDRKEQKEIADAKKAELEAYKKAKPA